MFTCGTCLRRSLQNLETDLPSTTQSILLTSIPTNVLPLSSLSHSIVPHRHHSTRSSKQIIQYRSHATLASLKRGHHRKQLEYLRDGSKAKNSPLSNQRRKAPWALSKVELRDAVARDRNRARMREETADGEIRNIRPDPDHNVLDSSADQTVEGKNERRLIRHDQKQVEVYYKDPLQLADGVLQRLRASDIEGALRLVRASQAFDIKNVVSWNHCCDWLMAQGHIKQALSVYNEMKKRGQKPDAHSYTIMLRGLSQHVDKPKAVQEAVKIYNSIFAPNSAVKPNTIHTNAIINVCARGGDLDSMWAVAGRLPERGAGSPDRVTFATILNAIRENTIKEVAKSADRLKAGKDNASLSEEEATEERRRLYAKAVEDGRKLWEDVSHRWRRADLVIDEQLVCAMGRLLLTCGVVKDVEQVLDLVEVTMNLRLKERKGKVKNQVAWLEAPTVQTPVEPADQQTRAPPSASELPLKESNVYATPGCNTLSMLLEVCAQVRAIQHYAVPYWRRLTDPEGHFKVEPDAANILAYLRLLRMQRASAEAYKLLAQEWPKEVARLLYRRASFVIAFSTCLRDKNNPNVFETAQKLLKLAEEKAAERAKSAFDDDVALGEMKYHQRKQILQETKKSLSGMTKEEKEEMSRNKEGVQSLNIDPKILNYFLELAVVTTQGWNEGIRGKDDGTIFERHPSRNHTLIALMTLASKTKDLKRLVKAKMEELQNSDMPRRRRERALDPRAGSRVGENLEDLLLLMRTLIGAWDKCLGVHERLKQAGRQGLDENIMSGFLDRKREMASYMARVEKTIGTTLRQRREIQREKQKEEEEEEEAEVDDSQPDIERRIQAVLQGVNANLISSRMQAKNSKSRTMRRYGDANNMTLTLSSRRQKTERDNLIKERLGKNFPKHEYGTLGADLQIISEKEAAVKQREQNRNMVKQGFVKGISSGTPGVRRTKERIPVGDHPRTKLTGMVDWKNSSPSRGRASILDQADVKSAWERQRVDM